MSSFAYADPAIEIPAYIHWPQPEKPQRPVTLWVTLGVAAAVSLFSGISVANAWSHMPDYDPNGSAAATFTYTATSDDMSAPSSRLVAFTPPPDYNSNEAPVIPAVYDEPVQASAAVQMRGEATFDQADLAVLTGNERSEQPATCAGACTQATPAADSGTGYDMPEAPIPYEAMTPLSASQNIPN